MQALQALEWTLRLLGFSLLLQSIEFLLLRRETSDAGFWPLPILKTDYHVFPLALRKLLLLAFKSGNFKVLTVLRIILSLALLIRPDTGPAVLLLITTLLTLWRFRGVFNGGSDSMTVLVLSAATLGLALKEHTLILKACLIYIGLQITLSYFLAGIVKVRNKTWWNGEALRAILGKSTSSIWTARLQSPSLSLTASWLILAFELLFPLTWFSPGFALILMIAGVSFHLANVYIFGLNRFLWAWAAGYPALYFCSFLLI